MSNLFSRLSLRANIVTAATAAFFLAACGGDGNKANEPDPSAEADFVVDSFDDLSVCIDNREGATAYVKDEDNAYICTNGDWAIDTNADTRKKSSNSKDEANSSNSKDKAKSSSSRHSEDSSSSRHCEDCKDEAISSSSSVGQKTAWEYLNPNIDYGEIVDDRDGQIYKTVTIRTQTWMAQNLNYATTDGSYCYGNSADGCAKYGRHYTWAAAMGKSEEDCGYGHSCTTLGSGNVQGECPDGWHIPTLDEWETLIVAADGSITKYDFTNLISKNVAGKKLKTKTGWEDYDGTSGNGTDAYGFSALPAGRRLDSGDFGGAGHFAFFWSGRAISGTLAYGMYLGEDVDKAFLDVRNKSDAFPVRCLMDDP
jgi:Fibrobacter succinogenes major domain (Fib_succ_major).